MTVCREKNAKLHIIALLYTTKLQKGNICGIQVTWKYQNIINQSTFLHFPDITSNVMKHNS